MDIKELIQAAVKGEFSGFEEKFDEIMQSRIAQKIEEKFEQVFETSENKELGKAGKSEGEENSELKRGNGDPMPKLDSKNKEAEPKASE